MGDRLGTYRPDGVDAFEPSLFSLILIDEEG